MTNPNRDTLQTLLIRIPVLILTFFHTVLLIRLLGKEGNGVYAFILANVELASVILTFNLNRVTTFFLAQNKYAKERIIGLAIWISLFAVLVFALLGILSFLTDSFTLNILLPDEHQHLFFVIFLISYFPIILIIALCDSLLRGHLQFTFFNKFAFFSNALLLLALGLAFLYQSYSPIPLTLEEIFFLLLSVQLFNVTVYLIVTIRVLHLRVRMGLQDKKLIRAFFTYAFQGYLAYMAHFLNKRIDIWFVEFYRGIGKLGLYALGASLTNFMLLATQPISQVLLPYLAKAKLYEGGQILMRYTRLSNLISITLAGIVFALAGWIIPFLFGQEFEGAILATRILLIGYVITAFREPINTFAAAQDRLRYIVYGNFLGVFVTIALDILLIPTYGIIGAGIASVCSYLTSTIFIAMRVFQDIQQPLYKGLFFTRDDWQYWKQELKKES